MRKRIGARMGRMAEGEPPSEAPRSEPPDEPPDAAADSVEGLRGRLHRLERLVDPEVRVLRGAEDRVLLPAWRRVTQGEPRWPVSLAVVVAIGLQVTLPTRVATQPRWLLPALAGLLLVGILVANPRRVDRLSPTLRVASMALIGVISLANIWSDGRLVLGLIRGTEGQNAGPLLLTGGAIWLTNVIVFALWYWELDRGGPAARVHAAHPYPDFLFPQMQTPDLAPDDWEPSFVDYLYVSFTNATAFSPTDVMPLSRWAKLTMMIQSVVSLATVALVIARAVNILK
jgi:hypothetical protein